MHKYSGFRHRQFESNTLLTSDHGTWAILKNSDFHKLQAGVLPKTSITKLVTAGIIANDHNKDDRDKRLIKWHSRNSKGPFLHIIELTKRCNLHCTYCHSSARPINKKHQDLSYETAKQIVDFIRNTPSPSLTIEFQGGESLLNWSTLSKTISYCRSSFSSNSKQVELSLVTNATLLNKSRIEFLRENKVSLCTSLDGPEYLHDIHRRQITGEGTYRKVIKNISLAEKHGLQVPFLSVISKQSLINYKELIDFCILRGVETLCANPVQPLGFAKKNWRTVGFSIDFYISNYRKLLDYMFENIRKGEFILERRFSLALDKISSDKDITFADFRNPCGAVYGQIAYGIDGTIYPCDEARDCKDLALGSVFKHSYHDIVISNLTKTIHDASIPNEKECSVCAYKPFCGICPVLAYSLSGKFTLKCNRNMKCQLNRFLFDYLFNKIINEPDDIKLIYKLQRLRNAFKGGLSDQRH